MSAQALSASARRTQDPSAAAVGTFSSRGTGCCLGGQCGLPCTRQQTRKRNRPACPATQTRGAGLHAAAREPHSSPQTRKPQAGDLPRTENCLPPRPGAACNHGKHSLRLLGYKSMFKSPACVGSARPWIPGLEELTGWTVQAGGGRGC